jgi:uncharacterized membrane protein
MTLATFAYIVGIIELLFGLPMLVSSKKAAAWIRKAFQDDVLIRVIGALFLVISVLVLLTEGTQIGTDVPGLIRLVAWLTVVKSLIFAWFPDVARDVRDKWLADSGMRTLWGLLATTIGVLFLLAGRALS